MHRSDVERLLRNAVFGPGATAMFADGIEPGVGIMVDESRDPALARAFARRAELDDDAFLAEWQTGDPPYGRTVLCPHAPQALFACTVSIARPVAVTRTFLLALSKTAHILTFLREPGATIWLVPQTVALARMGEGGARRLGGSVLAGAARGHRDAAPRRARSRASSTSASPERRS